MLKAQYLARVDATLSDLGIPPGLIAARGLLPCAEASELVIAEVDESGKEHLLTPDAAAAWRQLRDAANQDGLKLEIVSAFRSFDRQVEIVSGKLEQGISIEAILSVCAPPGFSEHHTGRAVDVTTPGCEPLEATFEHTAAFEWLQANARRFGFFFSYPRGNAFGYIFEPWHWCYRRDPATAP
jgi:D-alanyl-D-alanine carboxypeptidase